MDLFDKPALIEKILKNFIKTIAESSGVDKYDVLKCRGYIFTNKDGIPEFMGTYDDNFIKDNNGNNRIFDIWFDILDILTRNFIDSIMESLIGLIERLSADLNIPVQNVFICMATISEKVKNIVYVVGEQNLENNINRILRKIEIDYLFPIPIPVNIDEVKTFYEDYKDEYKLADPMIFYDKMTECKWMEGTPGLPICNWQKHYLCFRDYD